MLFVALSDTNMGVRASFFPSL